MLTVVLLLLGQQPLPPGQNAMPPNHPPMQGGSEPALPPNHPPMPGAGEPALPPNHPPMPGGQPAQAAPSMDDLMQRLDGMKDLADKDKAFEVAASLGRLYYAHGRYGEAVVYLTQAVEKAKPARELYAKQKKAMGSKPMPAAGSVGCAPKPDDKLEAQVELAKTKAKDPAAAAACLRAALHPLIEVETQLGNARFLTRDATGALAAYESALELFESNPEARYGRAALLLDTRGDDAKALEQAKGDFVRFLTDYPTSPRAKQAKVLLDRTNAAIAAGGITKLVAKGPNKAAAPMPDPHGEQASGAGPVLTQEMIDAVQNVERTPELEAGFDKLVEEAEGNLATGKFQDALDAYKRVVPFNPDNARARAGMAWSLVRLQKPMAQNVWTVALQDPASLDALGDTLQKKGDKEGARLLWQRLKDTAPGYASKVEGKLK